jgi:hypothetical protein
MTSQAGPIPSEIPLLREILESLDPGPIPVERREAVERALASAWHEFGGHEGGMSSPHKILNRSESLEWSPPVLSFVIERHGGTVLGSVWADLQRWDVDLDGQVARATVCGRRRVGEPQKAFRVDELARELAGVMEAAQEDARLERSRGGSYRVRSSVFPRASRQTTQGRMGRLSQALGAILAPAGWSQGHGGWWRPPDA